MMILFECQRLRDSAIEQFRWRLVTVDVHAEAAGEQDILGRLVRMQVMAQFDEPILQRNSLRDVKRAIRYEREQLIQLRQQVWMLRFDALDFGRQRRTARYGLFETSAFFFLSKVMLQFTANLMQCRYDPRGVGLRRFAGLNDGFPRLA
jgi:hypothetical protein